MPEICIACGIPMEKPEDHGLGNVTKPYCVVSLVNASHIYLRKLAIVASRQRRAVLVDMLWWRRAGLVRVGTGAATS